MGFIDNLSKLKNGLVNADWRILDSNEQIVDILLESDKRPVAILKHSTSCGISSMVTSGLSGNWDDVKEDVNLYYLDLIANRGVSNHVAETLGVIHQSPQLIILKDKKVIYKASHSSVNIENIKTALNTLD